MKLIVATHNAGKLKEFKEILSPLGYEISGLKDLQIELQWQETGKTFLENANIKIDAIEKAMPDCWILADDSGLCVDALQGAPGVDSSHYCGREGDALGNMNKLISELRNRRLEKSSAFFQCVIVLRDHKGVRRNFFGKLDGDVILNPRGSKGFGYDPIFVPSGFTQTLAEIDSERKNEISHRAKAVKEMLQAITLGPSS